MSSQFNKVADRFDQVHDIQTRHLPIPGDADDSHYLFLTAKRMPNGEWNIRGFHNLGDRWTSGLQKMQDAYIEIIHRHHADPPRLVEKLVICNDFDEAFLILRDMEESVLKHLGTAPTIEPQGHFMSSYRLLSADKQSRLDRLFYECLREKGPVLPRAVPPPGPKPAF